MSTALELKNQLVAHTLDMLGQAIETKNRFVLKAFRDDYIRQIDNLIVVVETKPDFPTWRQFVVDDIVQSQMARIDTTGQLAKIGQQFTAAIDVKSYLDTIDLLFNDPDLANHLRFTKEFTLAAMPG